MITRILGRSLLISHMMVTVLAVGLVLVTVGVERIDVPRAELVRALVLHALLAVVWLGPLLCGLATTATLTRMAHRGELTALACVGIGPSQLRFAVLCAGALMGACAFVLSAVFLPAFAVDFAHAWVWTGEGVWHADSQVLVDIQGDGRVISAPLSVTEIQRAQPRLAPWNALRWSGSLGEQVEIIARPARVLACVGFSALGLRAVNWRRPWVGLVGVGVVLLTIELLGWAMGAQGQIPVYVSGTLALWVWVVAAWPQPSMRSSLPV